MMTIITITIAIIITEMLKINDAQYLINSETQKEIDKP